MDFLKKKKAIPFSDFDDEDSSNTIAETIADEALLPPELLDREDIAVALEAAVSSLPPVYRAVLSLYYIDDFTFQEISEMLGESINTVKSRHRRALLKLRGLL